ncbi:hypothetical protein BKA15_002531 [Microlunatus parietis]|uniref:Uncharacterized protein n=1 Tax=Microlunatus parietis TaxID=682979 RepID=A0A7Y9I6T6_9ACTN|nr:hypothetical protein [Microlunatus parietis]
MARPQDLPSARNPDSPSGRNGRPRGGCRAVKESARFEPDPRSRRRTARSSVAGNSGGGEDRRGQDTRIDADHLARGAGTASERRAGAATCPTFPSRTRPSRPNSSGPGLPTPHPPTDGRTRTRLGGVAEAAGPGGCRGNAPPDRHGRRLGAPSDRRDLPPCAPAPAPYRPAPAPYRPAPPRPAPRAPRPAPRSEPDRSTIWLWTNPRPGHPAAGPPTRSGSASPARLQAPG